MAIAADALFIAQGLGKGLAQGNAHIFDGVVIVDVLITLGRDGHINQGVFGQLVEHMVKKPNAGRYFCDPRAVQGN